MKGLCNRPVLKPSAAFAGRREGLQWTYGPRARRDGRADDGGGLENRYAGDCIVGSNPTPSATLSSHTVPYSLIYLNIVPEPVIFVS